MPTDRSPLPSPASDLAAGFAAQLERWSLAHGAEAATAAAAARAGAALSLAGGEGHVCIDLEELPPLPEGDDSATAWRARLLAAGVAGTPSSRGAMPLVVDDDGRLYLHRQFDFECRLARRLRLARGTAPPIADLAALRDSLRRLVDRSHAGAGTPAPPDDGIDWQQIAVALALRGRLTLISGGPGTGKTTTVVRLLACLLDIEPGCRVALAAPTGKAAARLAQAIRERAGELPEALRRRLPAEASTVHRLLGAGRGGYAHDAAHPLPIDLLVVDEASMLDLALATRLLEAVPATARIVWLGDKDQLAAVEAGAVFSELALDPTLSPACVKDLAALTGVPARLIRPPAAARIGALADAVVWLSRNYRFKADSAIGRLAAHVNAGDAAHALAALRGGGEGGVRWLDDAGVAPAAATLQAMVDGHAAYVEAVRGGDPATVAAAFARFRVLCALREGPRGVAAVNEALTRRLRPALGADPWSAAYPGRPLMVLRNDPLLGLFNGDIGFTLAGDDGTLRVHFPNADGTMRALAPGQLPPHETAWAMTVHKAQGSEFDAVLVLLPAQRSRVLTRELLYTALTRARVGVTLCGGAPVLEAAIATPTRRRSGLLARLREAAAGDGVPPA